MTPPRDNDVMVTQVAALTPIGLGYQATREGLRRGVAALGPVARFGSEQEAAAELHGAVLPDFDPKQILGPKGLRSKDRNTLMVLCCIQADLAPALRDIGAPDRIGLALGTTFSSLTSQIEYTASYVRGGSRALNAMEFPNMVLNTPPSQANIWFDLAGSSTTITNGFVAGLSAIVFAADQIRCGRATHMVAGGADDLALAAVTAFARSGLASPSHQVRPLDRRRDGVLIGEGAGMLLLESRAAAMQRGATAVAQLLGYGAAFDGATSLGFNPAADGATLAMQTALDAARTRPEDIDFIAASAAGSPTGDAMEARAIHRVFGPHAAKVPVVAYNGLWGHCLGASGAMQATAALADLQDGVISATCGFETTDLALDVTTTPLTNAQPTVALVNAFGPTGNNVSLILRRV